MDLTPSQGRVNAGGCLVPLAASLSCLTRGDATPGGTGAAAHEDQGADERTLHEKEERQEEEQEEVEEDDQDDDPDADADPLDDDEYDARAHQEVGSEAHRIMKAKGPTPA